MEAPHKTQRLQQDLQGPAEQRANWPLKEEKAVRGQTVVPSVTSVSPFALLFSFGVLLLSILPFSSASFAVSSPSCSSMLSISCCFEADASLKHTEICPTTEMPSRWMQVSLKHRQHCSSTCLLEFSAIPQLLDYAVDFFPLQKVLPFE